MRSSRSSRRVPGMFIALFPLVLHKCPCTSMRTDFWRRQPHSGEILTCIQAFKPGDVDLPSAGAVAPLHAITLPDNYNDIEFLGTLTQE